MEDVDDNALTIGALRAAIDVGLAELDAGLGIETTPDQLIAEVTKELGLGLDGEPDEAGHRVTS